MFGIDDLVVFNCKCEPHSCIVPDGSIGRVEVHEWVTPASGDPYTVCVTFDNGHAYYCKPADLTVMFTV
jgi:hypothetical protein